MSCNSYRANYFRLFLYAAAFVVAHTMKHELFNGTAIESFTMDSFIKRIMLSAVYIVEKKTFIHVSFHRITGTSKNLLSPWKGWPLNEP